MRLDLRDSIHTFIGSGLMMPALLGALVVVNLATGWVWIPATYRWVRWIGADDSGFRVIILLKLAIAIMCFGWYGLGNLHPVDKLARPVTGIGTSLFAIAIVLAFVRILGY